MLESTDTIAAVASPPGGGALGLVRVTGPGTLAIVLHGFEPAEAGATLPPARSGRWSGRLQVAGLRRPLDVNLNLWPGTRTATGQPLAEIQTVGSPPVLAAVLAEILSRGARLAEPGEFTLRAFLAGRIDLTQAEAVLGVIDATSPAQLAVALGQLAGGLATPLTRLRDRLADTLAHLEANLDFADEADVDPLGRTILADLLRDQAAEVADLADRLGGRGRAGARPRVVLVGPPNAGKSRLFNALIGRDVALVAPVAGTTRDYLEATCVCDGLPVDLVDTAGLEATLTSIGAQSQAAQASQARSADLWLDCRPSVAPRPEASTGAPPAAIPRLIVATMVDLAPSDHAWEPGSIRTSAATGAGLAEIRSAIAAAIRQGTTDGSGAIVAATAARCGDGLAGAARSLAAAAEAVRQEQGDELVAVDLRQALDDLGRVVGAVVTDDLLDRIFRRFCIGK